MILKIGFLMIGLALFPSLHAKVYSQVNNLNFNLSNITIYEAIKTIEESTSYKFVYNNNNVDVNEKVSIIAEDENLSDIVSKLFPKHTALFRNNNIILTSKVNLVSRVKQQNERTVKGQVVDTNTGETIIGGNVLIKGTTRGVVTDINGQFSISISDSETVLLVSYIGYNNLEIRVGKRTNLGVINLLPATEALDEVVVIGYGTQKRESIIGAISTIKPSILQTNQTRSLTNSLAGQVAGVLAVQRSGEPGYDNSDFWIRGVNTFGANSKPLVLIDGIERSLDNISPEEIESFSMLKDATATAVYGVRGANGVILIQTKKGKKGKPTISFKADYGISNPTQLPEFVDAPKYMETLNEAQRLSAMNPLYSDEDITRTRTGYDPDLYPNVNWLKAVRTSNAPNGRFSMDVNGGSDRLRYSLIGTYFTESGMIVTDKKMNYNSQLKLDKFNVRSNVDLDLTESTLIAVSIGGYITDRNAPGIGISTILNRSMDTPPNYHPILYSNGQIPKVAARYNPWADATQTGYQKRFDSNVETSINVIQDIGKLWSPLRGLKASAIASFDAFNRHTQNRTKTPRSFYATGRDDEGELITTMIDQGQEFLGYSKSSGGNRTLYFEGRLNYNRRFKELHELDGLFLFNMRDHVIQDAGTSTLALPYRNMGIAGRAAYSYDYKYFTEFNFGYNGSENFKRGYRFGFFPSVALGWMISNEEFMENINSTISKLKLRGSWGLIGNDQIVDNRRFAYISTINSAPGYSFGYTGNLGYGGWREGDFGIDNMTWETAKKINIGVELGLWNFLDIQLDVFKENRDNIFMQRKTVPEIAGYNIMPYANYGKVENKGIETELILNHQFTQDWFVSARGSFTYAHNKIVEYDEPEALKLTTRARTGQSLNQHYGLIAEGLYLESDFEDVSKGILIEELPKPMFGSVKPGDIKYKDINNDGLIDSFDESPIGKPYVPEIVYGFGFNTRYKNVDFGVFFQGSDNFTNMLQGSTLIPGSGGGGVGNIYSNVDDRWTEESPSQNVFWPRLSNTESSNNMRNSTWWIRDASYLRLKNLEFGYTLPVKWQQKVLMKNARVYFRGSNLLTFAKFKMWDPEIGSQNGLKYPLQKIYTVGIEITF